MSLLLYFIILSGYIFTKGFYSIAGWLVMFFACFLFPFIHHYKINSKNIFTLKSLYIYLSFSSIILYGGLYQNNNFLIFVSYFLLLLNFILSIYLVLTVGDDKTIRLYFFLIFIALCLRLFMIWSSPNPIIDVFDYLKKGSEFFLQGKNPYTQIYTKLYPNFTPDYYGYFPGMLFLTLPSVALLKDPRYTFLFSEICISLLILYLSKKNRNKYIYSLLFLNNPMSLYMIEQSYTEPLIVLLLILFSWTVKNKKNLLMMVVVGLLIATKQYLVFLYPLILKCVKNIRVRIKLFIGATIVTVLLITPFLVWNYQEFLKDAVFLQGVLPPRYEGLSFFSLIFRFGGVYNNLISGIIIAGFLLYIYWQKKINVATFFYLSSFLYLIFFYFNKWAFLNYYYLISQLLLVSIVLDE